LTCPSRQNKRKCARRIMCLVVGFAVAPAYAQQPIETDMAARLASLQTLHAAAVQTPLARDELLGLCRGLDGARWCEGYIAAFLAIHQIPLECLPATDMAPFMNGQIWELTRSWLFQQEADERFTVLQALVSSLAEQTRCPMGEPSLLDGFRLLPYTEAEREEMRRCADMQPVTNLIPEYPPEALRLGLQGWVQVSFTVTTSGGVRDIRVVDADPAGVFDSSALTTAQQLQFHTCERNGLVTETPNVQHVFRFLPEAP
jgi:TonB family protein